MLTEINGNIDATYPIITGELTGYLGPIGTVTASADNSVGTPHVIVTQTPTPDGLDIDFAFKEMGIPGLDLTVEQDLTEEQQQTARENIDAQEILTFDAAPTQGSQNPVTSGGVYNSVADINAKIPAAASAQNKLADKEYVDDSINRTSAFFRGNFATYADLMAVAWQTTDPDAANYVSNNDYAFVAADETHSGESWRYIYVLEEGGQDNGWAAQYRVNESPLTPEQLAALNSGITSQGVSQIETNRQGLASHVSNTSNPHQVTKAQVGLGNVDNTSDANKPISTAQQAALDGKQDAISSTASVNSDKTPYLYRRAGGGLTIGNRAYSKLIGATIANNQLVQNGNFADGTTGWSQRYGSVTLSASGNVLTATTAYADTSIQANAIPVITGHKYLFFTSLKYNNALPAHEPIIVLGANSSKTLTMPTLNAWANYSGIINAGDTANNNFIIQFRVSSASQTVDVKNVMCADLTAMFGSTIADYAYTLEQGQAGAGVAWLKSYGFFSKYAPYDAGSLISTKAEKKKVVGRNLFNENAYQNLGTDYEFISPNQNYHCKAIQLIPNTEYTISQRATTTSGVIMVINNVTEVNQAGYFDTRTAGGSKSFTTDVTGNLYIGVFKTTANADANARLAECKIQIELGSTATAYTEYVSQEYDLGSDELRGLFKLDANNNIVADGDIKTSDGTITRKYGIVDLGTLEWTLTGAGNFQAQPSGMKNSVASKQICLMPLYDYDRTSSSINKTYWNTSYLYVRDESYATANAFKTAMSGKYLVYELATPTTEQSTPYQDPQEVFADGTEEYIDTRTVPVPVGHETDYPGITYLVSKLGSETAFSPFASDVPPAPTSDGTYVLQVSVSSGTPFYRWVSAAELVGE